MNILWDGGLCQLIWKINALGRLEELKGPNGKPLCYDGRNYKFWRH